MSIFTASEAVAAMLSDKLGLVVAGTDVDVASLVIVDAVDNLQVGQHPAVEVIPQRTVMLRELTDITVGKPTYLVRHELRIDCTVRGQNRAEVARLRLLFAEAVKATLLLNADVSAYANLTERQIVLDNAINLDVGPIDKGWSGFCTLMVSAQMIEIIEAAVLDELFTSLTFDIERLPFPTS